jgi:hypothetical protein
MPMLDGDYSSTLEVEMAIRSDIPVAQRNSDRDPLMRPAGLSLDESSTAANASEAERRRVLVIARDFPPCRLIGAQACAQIARYFPLYGWDPLVLTVKEGFLEAPDPNDRRDFPGRVIRTSVVPHPMRIYGKLKESHTSGVSKNQQGKESGKRSHLRNWLLAMLQIPDMYTGWIPPATVAGLWAIHRYRISHIFSSAPFWTNHLVGLVLKFLTRLPWTVHLRDPWTQVKRPRPVSKLSLRLEKWLERLVMSHADMVVCVTERHTQLLRETFDRLSPKKFITIPNGYDEAEWSEFDGTRNTSERDRDQFVITFTGSFYRQLSPRPLFRAIRRLFDTGEISASEVRVDLVGFCDDVDGVAVRDMAAECGVSDCVHIGPPLSRPESLRRMQRSDLLLVLAEGLDLQIPGKTYEYLRAGRPILALTSDGALADLLHRTGGAWIVEPTDDAAIAAAVREAYLASKTGQPCQSADTAIVAEFDRRVLSGRFAALFEQYLPFDTASLRSKSLMTASPSHER